jgi:iron complex transport system ATP-binding protein
MMRAPVIALQQLTIGYRQRRRSFCEIAGDISVQLNAGELVCLLGPNGAGKSTLIRTIFGRQLPLAGSVLLEGKPLTAFSARELAQRMSIVLTQRIAAGMMPVITLVAMGRYPFTDWTGKLTAHDLQAIHRAMDAAGIAELSHRPVCELSDGERQKVMIARALAQEPQVMMLDEATAFLDLPHRVELMCLLRRLAHADGRAILLSTHDLDLALRCADRLWLLSRGGVFRQGVPEDLVLTDSFAATFADGGVQFDKAAGAFRHDSLNGGIIALCGEGIAAVWTARALERIGYQVVGPDMAQICVEIEVDGANPVWKIRGIDIARFKSIEALLMQLKQLDPSKPAAEFI